MFALAIMVIVCSIGVLVLHRQELPMIGGASELAKFGNKRGAQPDVEA